jgi:hypothetical protein
MDEIVIRVFFSRELGVRLHAMHRDDELVVALLPLRVLQGDAPQHIRAQILQWATHHERELLDAWHRYEIGRHPYAHVAAA